MKSFLIFCALNFLAGISGVVQIQKTFDPERSRSHLEQERLPGTTQNTNDHIPDCVLKFILNQNKIYIHDGENNFRKIEEMGESRRAEIEPTASRERKEQYVQKLIESFESKGLSKAEILKLLQELHESTRHEDLKEIYQGYINKYQK